MSIEREAKQTREKIERCRQSKYKGRENKVGERKKNERCR